MTDFQQSKPSLQYLLSAWKALSYSQHAKMPQWIHSSDCEKQQSWALLDAVMEVAVLRDFARAQCFSFVLIRHSQSCWLQGWFCCEIMSLIKRPL